MYENTKGSARLGHYAPLNSVTSYIMNIKPEIPNYSLAHMVSAFINGYFFFGMKRTDLYADA